MFAYTRKLTRCTFRSAACGLLSASYTSQCAGYSRPNAGCIRQCAAYTSSCASYTSSCAGYTSSCASYTWPSAGYISPPATYTSQCAGYTRRCASYIWQHAIHERPMFIGLRLVFIGVCLRVGRGSVGPRTLSSAMSTKCEHSFSPQAAIADESVRVPHITYFAMQSGCHIMSGWIGKVKSSC